MDKRAFGGLLIATVVFGTTILFGRENQDLVAAGNQAAQAKVFDVRSYGAIGDGIAMDTEAIQQTIDACHTEGGGIVRVPAGAFQIGTIWLRSNIILSLDYGASLLGSHDIADYKTEGLSNLREGGPHCLIYADNASNIVIEGLGVIDGRGTPEFFPRIRSRGREKSKRPCLIRMVNCDQLTFSGVTYRRPAFWGIHLIDCRNIHFSAVTIRFRNNGYNNDGLDLDGCANVLIENCDIDSGDDAVWRRVPGLHSQVGAVCTEFQKVTRWMELVLRIGASLHLRSFPDVLLLQNRSARTRPGRCPSSRSREITQPPICRWAQDRSKMSRFTDNRLRTQGAADGDNRER